MEHPAHKENQGADGNANVIISDWFQIEFDYIDSTDTNAHMIIPIENLDGFLQNGGAILLYIKWDEGTFVDILPLPVDTRFFYFVSTLEGGIIFNAVQNNVGNLENTPQVTLQYVLIPGNASARMNLNDSKIPYQELMEHLDIK
ncbi:MAG TPA: hypothetical protein VKY41_02950 [Xanthomarina sp.]|nr:hypothetical protein [Xanthomarina sp.]